MRTTICGWRCLNELRCIVSNILISQNDGEMDMWTHGQMHRDTVRQTDRQTDTQKTDTQKDGQTDKPVGSLCLLFGRASRHLRKMGKKATWERFNPSSTKGSNRVKSLPGKCFWLKMINKNVYFISVRGESRRWRL